MNSRLATIGIYSTNNYGKRTHEINNRGIMMANKHRKITIEQVPEQYRDAVRELVGGGA